MRIPMGKCKRRLAMVWFVGAGILFLLLVLQSILGRYGDRVNEAWAWFLPTVLPTLSLIIAVLASEAINRQARSRYIDSFMYRLALSLSIAYLIVVSGTFFLKYFSTWSQLELMRISNLWLGPMQGMVAAGIGIFFVREED